MKDIHDYIALDKPDSARRTVDAIFQKVQLLLEFPEMGYRYQSRKDRDIRVLLYGHYRIAYLITEDSNIDILGVFHGALEIDKYLL